ncbi:uncharacterized protein LOC131214473 [Anopheles bellator]|uniref:uncharacterized protein LOC131214473 n=1 Tax=Anopheles bellator TaxID=139047 RepID=UPI002647DE2D|nr:uncharacterized protein LOC131214473 [Anopheles bellator]
MHQVTLFEIEGGSYWHHGLEICLRYAFHFLDTPRTISLNINVDGMQVFNSGKKQMWPILGNVYEEPDLAVFVVGVFYGLEKPRRVQSFLDRFTDEYFKLMESGCTINGHRLTVKHRAFIFDSPARSFCKGVVSFNATCGCIKCLAERRKHPESGVITYQVEEAALRTDAAFRTLKAYVGHHQEGPVSVAGYDS